MRQYIMELHKNEVCLHAWHQISTTPDFACSWGLHLVTETRAGNHTGFKRSVTTQISLPQSFKKLCFYFQLFRHPQNRPVTYVNIAHYGTTEGPCSRTLELPLQTR